MDIDRVPTTGGFTPRPRDAHKPDDKHGIRTEPPSGPRVGASDNTLVPQRSRVLGQVREELEQFPDDSEKSLRDVLSIEGGNGTRPIADLIEQYATEVRTETPPQRIKGLFKDEFSELSRKLLADEISEEGWVTNDLPEMERLLKLIASPPDATNPWNVLETVGQYVEDESLAEYLVRERGWQRTTVARMQELSDPPSQDVDGLGAFTAGMGFISDDKEYGLRARILRSPELDSAGRVDVISFRGGFTQAEYLPGTASILVNPNARLSNNVLDRDKLSTKTAGVPVACCVLYPDEPSRLFRLVVKSVETGRGGELRVHLRESTSYDAGFGNRTHDRFDLPRDEDRDYLYILPPGNTGKAGVKCEDGSVVVAIADFIGIAERQFDRRDFFLQFIGEAALAEGLILHGDSTQSVPEATGSNSDTKQASGTVADSQ